MARAPSRSGGSTSEVKVKVRQMGNAPMNDPDRGQPTVKILDECLNAIEADQSRELPHTAERAEFTERLESGLDYIEFTGLTGSQADVRWDGRATMEPSGTPSRQVGEYLLVREIGRGGMGVVYEAVQPALARRVALKILPYSRTLDTRQLLRFRNESLAAARLDHPNIVRVISVGHDCGMHYYAMQYVEGESLADVLNKLRRTEPGRNDSTQFAAISQGIALVAGEAANGERANGERAHGDCASSPTVGPEFFRRVSEWGVQAADALEHAHAVGVIHRDIKPSNLLLDSCGRILIADFGVALMQNAPELTMTGDLLGTARYMSPEQWQGKLGLVDHRADIYSLGATLYELLTLRPVLRGEDREQLHRQIVDETPLAPRSLMSSIPRDLETIVLKALAKDREDRYSTAQEMADDLRRFLNDHPIRARRPTLPQRVFRWARRHRTLVAAGVAALALVTVGLAVSTSIMLMQREQIQSAMAANGKLVDKARASERRAELANNESQNLLYSSNVRLAYRAWHTADLGYTLQSLKQQLPGAGELDRRGFEWHLLWRMTHAHHRELTGHRDQVYATAYSRDGKWLATAGKDTEVRIFYAATGELRHRIQRHVTDVNGLAFRDDSRQLATASEDGVVRLFDTETGELEARLVGHARGVFCVRYAAGGNVLVSAGRGGTVRLWDPRDYCQIGEFEAHPVSVEALDVSPDGKLLATASRDDTIGLWDLATQKQVRSLPGHHDTVLAVAFSPDGQQLASGGEDYLVLLWDVASGKILKQMNGHDEWVQSVAFAGQGKVIVSASKDNTVRLWEAESGKTMEVLPGHCGRIWNVNVSPDGETLVTAGADGAVKLWRWPAVQKYGTLAAPQEPFRAVAVSPDGQTFATAGDQGRLSLHDMSTGRVKSSFAAHDDGCGHIAFAAGGASLVTAGGDGRVRLWNTSTGQLIQELGQCDEPIQSLRVHPSSREVMCLSGNGDSQSTLSVWRLDSMATHAAIVDASLGETSFAEFSPQGTSLVFGRTDGELVVMVCGTRRLAHRWQGHDHRISQICFNAEGTLLATAADDGLIKIWSWPGCQLEHSLHGHSGAVPALAFSGDSRTLASGGDDGSVRLWSVLTGQELTILATFEHHIKGLAFLPMGRGLMAMTSSHGPDALVSWFTDATAWPHPLLGPSNDQSR